MTEDKAISIIENYSYDIILKFCLISVSTVSKSNKIKIFKLPIYQPYNKYIFKEFILDRLPLEEDLKNEKLWITFMSCGDYYLFKLAENLKQLKLKAFL